MIKNKQNLSIYLADLVHNHVTGNYVVPLNIANIASYLVKEFRDDVSIRLFKYPQDLIQAVRNQRPDILGLSNYFWNSELNAKLGERLKREFPEMIIVMGGPSIRTDRESIKLFLQQHGFLDFYVLYEGERPFSNIVRKLLQEGKDNIIAKDINGCASLHENNLLYTTFDIFKDLSELPSPYLNGFLDEFLLRGLTPIFESNRGCPYTCTFCTWGISALKKVRKFPLDRILNEMDYVNNIAPKNFMWVFGDANFGIFPRDIEIARHIAKIKAKNSCLSRVIIWMDKNQFKRGKEITRLISDFEYPLMAVQTWDPIVEKNIKRRNIKPEDAVDFIREFKKENVKMATDIMCGLPGETYESHLKTLRAAFTAGFDFIKAVHVVMLPGSELETDDSRKKFDIHTKYRLRQGNYGEYDGIKVIESEEVIRELSLFKESEMINCRILHWLIWMCWNGGFLKPLLMALQDRAKINPLDFFLHIINKDKSNFSQIDRFFKEFIEEDKREWFDSVEELQKFYGNSKNWKNLLEIGFPKMNFAYTAKLILSQELRNEFYNFLSSILSEDLKMNDPILNEILLLCREKHLSPYDIMSELPLNIKKYDISREMIPYFDSSVKMCEFPLYDIILIPDIKKIETIKKSLAKYNFDKDQNYAVQKTLESFSIGFQYKILVEEKKTITKTLIKKIIGMVE